MDETLINELAVVLARAIDHTDDFEDWSEEYKNEFREGARAALEFLDDLGYLEVED